MPVNSFSSSIQSPPTATSHVAVPPDESWLSIHLFYDGDIYGPLCDDLVRAVVHPVIAECREANLTSGAFFIRYSEDGPHVRLRLLCDAKARSDALSVAERWWREWAIAPSNVAREVREVPYEPEVDRYGGPSALPVAESFFARSTEFALTQLVPDVSADRGSRLGRAVLAALTSLHAWFGSREAVAESARKWAISYMNIRGMAAVYQSAFLAESGRPPSGDVVEYVEQAWAALADGDSLYPALDAYWRAATDYATAIDELCRQSRVAVRGSLQTNWSQARGSLGGSQLHMTNNRLGISIPEEVVALLRIHQVLRADN